MVWLQIEAIEKMQRFSSCHHYPTAVRRAYPSRKAIQRACLSRKAIQRAYPSQTDEMKSRPAWTESKTVRHTARTQCVKAVYRRLLADVSCWSLQAAVESFNDAPNICSIARISHFCWSKFERASEGVSARSIRRIQSAVACRWIQSAH